MDRERLLDFADIIRYNRVGVALVMAGFVFNETQTRKERILPEDHPCGTAACLAGTAIICAYGFDRALKGEFPGRVHSAEAQRIFDLDSNQRSRLFFPIPEETGGRHFGEKSNDFFTRERCARVVTHLAHTGEVNWRI